MASSPGSCARDAASNSCSFSWMRLRDWTSTPAAPTTRSASASLRLRTLEECLAVLPDQSHVDLGGPLLRPQLAEVGQGLIDGELPGTGSICAMASPALTIILSSV